MESTFTKLVNPAELQLLKHFAGRARRINDEGSVKLKFPAGTVSCSSPAGLQLRECVVSFFAGLSSVLPGQLKKEMIHVTAQPMCVGMPV